MAGIDYYCAVHTVTAGAPVWVAVDLTAELLAKARAGGRFVQIRSDRDLYVRLNQADADSIVMDISVNPELTIQHSPIPITVLYLKTVGGCITGDATVQVLVL